MRLLIIIALCTLSASFPGKAQDMLTLEDAMAIGLKNNFSILVARNKQEITNINYSPGNAGFLPQVNATGALSSATNATKQEYASGLVVDRDGARSTSLSGGVGMQWTLFDGLKMFAVYGRYRDLMELGDIETKIAIENVVERIIQGYFQVVRQTQALKYYREVERVSADRLEITRARVDAGASSRLEMLQATLDLNAAKSNILRQETQLSAYKIELNEILGRASEIQYEVLDAVSIDYLPVYDDLKKTVPQENYQLMAARKGISLAERNLKEVRADFMPRLGVYTNYNYAKTENQVGIVLFNQNLGYNFGLTASYTLFNGFQARNRYSVARVQVENAALWAQEVRLSVEASLLKAFTSFHGALDILSLEEENFAMAGENLQLALDRFALGAINSLQLKEAQKSYEEAENRLVTARYEAKLAETRLRKLNGDLVRIE